MLFVWVIGCNGCLVGESCGYGRLDWGCWLCWNVFCVCWWYICKFWVSYLCWVLLLFGLNVVYVIWWVGFWVFCLWFLDSCCLIVGFVWIVFWIVWFGFVLYWGGVVDLVLDVCYSVVCGFDRLVVWWWWFWWLVGWCESLLDCL